MFDQSRVNRHESVHGTLHSCIPHVLYGVCVEAIIQYKRGIFKELHKDHENNCSMTYRAGAAVMSNITKPILANMVPN